MKRKASGSETNSKDAEALCCPQCGAKLLWDAEQRKLRSAVAGMPVDKDFSLQKAAAAIREEQGRADQKFREAMQAEHRRKEALSDRFEKSLRQTSQTTDPPPRPFNFD